MPTHLEERTRTPTDLDPNAVQAVSEAVNPLIADDDEPSVPPEEMIRRLLDDNRQMAEQQRAAIRVCEEQDDTPTANVLQEILDGTEKRVWFLHAVSQGGRNIE